MTIVKALPYRILPHQSPLLTPKQPHPAHATNIYHPALYISTSGSKYKHQLAFTQHSQLIKTSLSILNPAQTSSAVTAFRSKLTAMYANNAIFLIIALIALVIIIGAWIAVRYLNGTLNRYVGSQPVPYVVQQPVVGPARVPVPAEKPRKAPSAADSRSTEEGEV